MYAQGRARNRGRSMPKTGAEGYLEGQLLIAMPTMEDPRFSRSVIYLCAHNAEGAMGLVVNKELDLLTFSELLEQVGVKEVPPEREIRILFGGPVETGRGFVLHSAEYHQDSTLSVNEDFAVTASVEILRDIARGVGPKSCILALGYAGWSAGQLENEIQANGWLNAAADPGFVFETDIEEMWEKAIAGLGIDHSKLTGQAGHA